jgi:hypothetical protein
MSRKGGEADKDGNRYELRWLVSQLLRVILGEARSLTVEALDDLGDGVEMVLNTDTAVEVHQVKRQNGMSDQWSLADLNSRDVLSAAAAHVQQGRRFRFVSTVSSRIADELSTRAKQATSLQQFTSLQLTNKELNGAFPTLVKPNYLASSETAWLMLRGSSFEQHNEDDIVNMNAAIAGQLYQGLSGRTAAAALGDLIWDHLGVELTPEVIDSQLPKYKLVPTSAAQAQATNDTVDGLTAKWLGELQSQIMQPEIVRPEADELGRLVSAGTARMVFVVGAAGGGKSVLLHDFVRAEVDRGTPVLAFRLDRLDGFKTTQDIGEGLALGMSPVSALKLAMGEQTGGVLVVDQLDAVSQLSGRAPASFPAVADLIQEARAFPEICVVIACRKFDLQNDHRIASLASGADVLTFSVGVLTDEQIDLAVRGMKLDPARLTSQQREILKTPLHLVLLGTTADEPDALGFQTSTHLFQAFWDRKRLAVNARRAGVDFGRVLSVLANKMSSRQQLAVPRSVLDIDGLASDADILESEHVLIRDGANLSFFHESFFDYVFSRAWIAEEASLVEFLTAGEQELFRRAQVRQILTNLHDSEPRRFLTDLGELLSDERVRFHIKAAAISIVRAMSDPTRAEARLLVRLADARPELRKRIETLFRSPVWFERLDGDGYIEEWLDGTESMQNRALNVMGSAGERNGDRLAELLEAHRAKPHYAAWARWVLRFADINNSRALFDTLVEAVRSGFYLPEPGLIWISVFRLAEVHPEWGTNLLRAYFIEQPGALDLDDGGKVARLMLHDRQVLKLIQSSAEADPQGFVAAFLPYILTVMAATAMPSEKPRPQRDLHFSFRQRDSPIVVRVADSLFVAVEQALRRLADTDPEATRHELQKLAADPHDAAQFLLYSVIMGNPPPLAEWAVSILLEDPSRFLCGYIDDPVWRARELLEVIQPFVSDDSFAALEVAVRDLQFEWEAGAPGHCAFKLLTVLDEKRLSEQGRKRLAELRTTFGREQPSPPTGMQTGSIGSPIRSDIAQKMSDEEWLAAMSKYESNETDWQTFTGGARELSQVFREQVKDDPERFAKLSLDLTADHSTAYGDAVLMGLGDTDPIDDPELIFTAVRQIASFHHDANDRWIGSALRPYRTLVPDDIVELILDRALTDEDPADDGIRVWSNDRETGERIPDVFASGINTTRGSLAEALAELLITDDAQGTRTALVAPRLGELAKDPSIPVRTCMARVVAASLLYARPSAVAAFHLLVDTDDSLLTASTVSDLVLYIGNGDGFAVVRPVVERMLVSELDAVREVGGQLACFAAVEWSDDDMLNAVVASDDSWVRRGAAMMAALRAPRAANAAKAATALGAFLDDDDIEVRRQAATIAAELRDARLRPYRNVLKQLINSNTFSEALGQLVLALEHAPDDVDDIILLCAQRFVDVLGIEASDIRTGAAGDAGDVAQLVISAYFRAQDASERSALLDVLDGLLEVDAFGIDEVITASER